MKHLDFGQGFLFIEDKETVDLAFTYNQGHLKINLDKEVDGPLDN